MILQLRSIDWFLVAPPLLRFTKTMKDAVIFDLRQIEEREIGYW